MVGCEALVEEEGGAFSGKDDERVAEIVSDSSFQVFGDQRKERVHGDYVRTWGVYI